MSEDIFREFSRNVGELFVKPEGHQERLAHAALGVCTEAGEIGSSVKAFWIYGREIDYYNVIEEVGDCLFYLQAIGREMGFDLDDAMRENIAKLRKRYPNGYSDKAANERADKT